MRGKLGRYFRSTFVRYMVSYVLLLALLLSCIFVFMYNYTRKSLYENTLDSEINKLASVRYQNEGYVSIMTSICEQLSLSSSVTPFTFADSPEKAYALINLLKPYTITNDFCDQIYVLFNIDDHLYSSSSSVSLDMFLNIVMTYENVSAAQMERMLRDNGVMRVLPSQNVVSEMLDGSASRTVTVIMPLGRSRANSLGNVIFLIPESKFHLLLDDEIADQRNRYILYNGEIVVASENFELSRSYVKQSAENIYGVRTVIRRVAGRKYLIITVPGESQSFSYLTVIPLASIYRAAASGWVSIVVILLAFALPCLAFMMLISRNNYRPIRELRNLFSDGASPGAEDDDILAIRSGISDLFGRNRDLDSRLTMSLPARRILCVQGLVKARYPTREDAIAAALDVGLDAAKPYFCVMLLGAPSSGHGEVHLDKLIAEAPEGVSCAGTDLLAFEQHLIIAFADETHLLHEYAGKLCQMPSVKSARSAVSMSDVHDELADMPKAYLEATSAYENRFLMGDARVLCFSDISSAARNVVPQSRSYTDAIKQAIASGDSAMLNARMDDLVMFLKHTDMSLFAFRVIYNDVIGAILSQTDARVNEDTELIKLYDLFTLSNCRSIDDLDGILRKLCALITDGAKDDGQLPLVKDILAYMAENYADQEFSLTTVAEKFNLSTTRLSLVFKEGMHMTPSDYLTMLRMERSKKLLKQTDMSIKDICGEVGYYDVSSYIRRFKQYASVTPLQYRQGARNAQEDK